MNRKKAVEKLTIFRKIKKYITGINIVIGPNNTYAMKAFKLSNFFSYQFIFVIRKNKNLFDLVLFNLFG